MKPRFSAATDLCQKKIFFHRLSLSRSLSLIFFLCHPLLPPWPCAGCRADLGSIAAATETEADVTLVAGRLAGALIVTVMEMQLDGTSSVALRREGCVHVGECVSESGWWREGGWHGVNSPHPLVHTHTHTHNHSE